MQEEFMKVQRIDSDVFVFTGEAFDSNSTVFVNRGEALIIDGLASKRDAEELKKFIESELGKRVRYCISTHYFSDHMAAFRHFPDADIIAHTLSTQTFDSEQFRTAEETLHFVHPTVQVSNDLRMNWGRFHLNIFYNPGHTVSTLNIDVPEIDMLVAGDTAVGNIVYLNYSSPSILGLALDRLSGIKRTNLIEGHGGISEFDKIDHARDYVRRLGEEVSKARQHADSKSAILAIELDQCMSPGIQGTDFEAIFHKRNLQTIIERNLFLDRIS
jgi:glyoxylase-like metal-dependent hydrolase (beta-lactamase superfamily II)